MAQSPAISRTFRVGRLWRCTWTIQKPVAGTVASSVVEWEPDIPGRPLNEAELRDYRAGRNAVMADLAEQTGMKTMVVET